MSELSWTLSIDLSSNDDLAGKIMDAVSAMADQLRAEGVSGDVVLYDDSTGESVYFGFSPAE